MNHNLLDSLRDSQLSLIEYQSTLGNEDSERLRETLYLKSLGHTLQVGVNELSGSCSFDDLEAMGTLVDEFRVVVTRFVNDQPAPIL